LNASAEVPGKLDCSAPIRIRDDVYWDECGGQIIIVEMESGKYFALDAAGSQVWKALAAGVDLRYLACDSAETGDCNVNVSTMLNTLLGRRLIESSENQSSIKRRRNLLARFIGHIGAYRSTQTFSQRSRWGKFRLFIEAYFLLIVVDTGLRWLGFHGLFTELARASGSSSSPPSNTDQIEWLSDISLSAFRWYRPHVACMHRAFSIYLLLRRHGIPAELCLGVEHRPFESHAWAEHHGKVLGDSQAFCKTFRVIARIV
jgi:hypothetical protein